MDSQPAAYRVWGHGLYDLVPQITSDQSTRTLPLTSCFPLGSDVLVGNDPTTVVSYGSLNCSVGSPVGSCPSPHRHGHQLRFPKLDLLVGVGTVLMGVPPARAAESADFGGIRNSQLVSPCLLGTDT